MKIGIDLMGGDQSPQTIFEAILQVSKDPDCSYSFIAFVHPDWLPLIQGRSSKIECIAVPEFIEMHETPLLAMRRKKKSSMAIGLTMLKEEAIDAFVSTGNTGALIANATHILSLFEKIQRPALLALMPSEARIMAVLDVGASVMCTASQLVQFALLGACYQFCSQNIPIPRIGLLNMGVEEEKGTEEVQKAYQILQNCTAKMSKEQAPFFFLGNIEGREVFQGKVDVLVTDGFSGNIFLKTAEGISTFMLDYLELQLGKDFIKTPDVLRQMHLKFNYAEYPGALLCGLNGLVIKCHGNSNIASLTNGIKGALKLCQMGLIEKMRERYHLNLTCYLPNEK